MGFGSILFRSVKDAPWLNLAVSGVAKLVGAEDKSVMQGLQMLADPMAGAIDLTVAPYAWQPAKLDDRQTVVRDLKSYAHGFSVDLEERSGVRDWAMGRPLVTTAPPGLAPIAADEAPGVDLGIPLPQATDRDFQASLNVKPFARYFSRGVARGMNVAVAFREVAPGQMRNRKRSRETKGGGPMGRAGLARLAALSSAYKFASGVRRYADDMSEVLDFLDVLEANVVDRYHRPMPWLSNPRFAFERLFEGDLTLDFHGLAADYAEQQVSDILIASGDSSRWGNASGTLGGASGLNLLDGINRDVSQQLGAVSPLSSFFERWHGAARERWLWASE